MWYDVQQCIRVSDRHCALNCETRVVSNPQNQVFLPVRGIRNCEPENDSFPNSLLYPVQIPEKMLKATEESES